MEFTREIQDALGAPFPEDEIEFLPRATSGGKALGLAYIDARSVMRRLDAAVGPGNWSYDFDVLSGDGKMVKGRLTVLGVTKCDAGEANAEDEPLKSAVSDALKRCAVHFGIGRYLYYLPRVWAPYDAQRRQFVEPPKLSPAAVEKALAICGIAVQGRGARGEGRVNGGPAPVARPAAENAAPVERAAVPQRSAAAERPSAAERPVVSERPATANRPPAAEAPMGTDAPGEGPKKSIWTAGAGANRPAESSGDRAATSRPAGAEAESAGAMVCSGQECGRALTKGQHDVSVRSFGRPLCPACQKQQARMAA